MLFFNTFQIPQFYKKPINYLHSRRFFLFLFLKLVFDSTFVKNNYQLKCFNK